MVELCQGAVVQFDKAFLAQRIVFPVRKQRASAVVILVFTSVPAYSEVMFAVYFIIQVQHPALVLLPVFPCLVLFITVYDVVVCHLFNLGLAFFRPVISIVIAGGQAFLIYR